MAPATQKAPAKDSVTAGKMTQKSLMSFFNKAGASSSSKPKEQPLKAGKATPSAPAIQSSKTADALERALTDTSSDPPVPPGARTPVSKHASSSSIVIDATYTRSSDGAHSYAQTPPTSDPIDVDMLSPDEDQVQVKKPARATVSGSVILDRVWTEYMRINPRRKSERSFWRT